MDKYIYFVSQLPVLHFDREPAVSLEAFLAEGRKWLSDRDYAILSRVDLQNIEPEPGDPAFLKQYKDHERDFRDDFVQWRKTRGAEQEHKPRFFSLATLREGTPLDAERLLLRWKWDFMDGEEHVHHFDLEFLIIYFLKLKILHRLMAFDSEQGLENYHQLCEAEV